MHELNIKTPPLSPKRKALSPIQGCRKRTASEESHTGLSPNLRFGVYKPQPVCVFSPFPDARRELCVCVDFCRALGLRVGDPRPPHMSLDISGTDAEATEARFFFERRLFISDFPRYIVIWWETRTTFLYKKLAGGRRGILMCPCTVPFRRCAACD